MLPSPQKYLPTVFSSPPIASILSELGASTKGVVIPHRILSLALIQLMHALSQQSFTVDRLSVIPHHCQPLDFMKPHVASIT